MQLFRGFDCPEIAEKADIIHYFQPAADDERQGNQRRFNRTGR